MKNSLIILLVVLCIPLSSCFRSSHHEVSTQPSNKIEDHADKVTKPEHNKAHPKPVPVPPQANPKEELVVYNGPIEHIFFHPLIIYPELAFDGDAMSKGYDDYFVTVKEFKKMLDSLYRKNFMLIKMSDLFQEQMINGKVTLTKKELKLPKNKKPLIISVDDLNYYQYMKENGNAYKLIIDREGEIATYSKDKTGAEIISRDNEIVPILNSFVKEHPDFSFNGAKGILALTGYEGILGYRTHELTNKSYAHEKDGAKRVVDKLKKDGWEFASHGYGHLDTRKVSLSTLRSDTERWKKEVEPLIGKTNIYIYPYGSSVLPGDPKFQALRDYGFSIFCSVGPNPYLSISSQYAMMDRVHIDGIGLRQQKDIMARFFNNSDEVMDPERNQ
ncbi:polysaccharide deacetylase family protein [Parageobacillus sp. VR-IP]|uniref:polysaccharide deacetylase family protein n=1 Tax=Parageobacillus sp. VR-IP TaxID=2742205 RepID=UPI0015830583|nr:polysaccharide deacetylase family protein [Parageobacillus sp. VR-IP]NUK31324.1 polysaccharide deacetylase family protein [Parageobacillus sp. VR-IP]